MIQSTTNCTSRLYNCIDPMFYHIKYNGNKDAFSASKYQNPLTCTADELILPWLDDGNYCISEKYELMKLLLQLRQFLSQSTNPYGHEGSNTMLHPITRNVVINCFNLHRPEPLSPLLELQQTPEVPCCKNIKSTTMTEHTHITSFNR